MNRRERRQPLDAFHLAAHAGSEASFAEGSHAVIASTGSLLVRTEELASRLGAPRLRIVDIRGSIKPPTAPKPWYAPKREAYVESHLPGAVFVDWTEDIVEPTAPVHMALAGPERFKQLMERLGIGDDAEIVVYDDTGGLAPRLWWALNYYGHPDVRVLDGGWTKWVAEGRPVTSSVPEPTPAVFTPRVQPGWRADTAAVKTAILGASAVVVDCRSPEEWRGEIGRGERAKGRIPGALNLPSSWMLEGEHRTWRAPEEIRDLCARQGITSDRPVITYCNAGVSAAVGLFALKLAGYASVANYAGSWYEWESDPANPVDRG
jgi:thiosulfate/3-mercaptopyruvate sulfurtransferase